MPATWAEIAHPRVIRVYDYGVTGDAPYYTMELLDGDDLSARRVRAVARRVLLGADRAAARVTAARLTEEPAARTHSGPGC